MLKRISSMTLSHSQQQIEAINSNLDNLDSINPISSSASNLNNQNNSSVQNIELILEQLFDYHCCYQWDKAREYIEHERDQFRHSNSHNSILISMLHFLGQMIMADKNYLMLTFFQYSSKVFQRKDLLKSTYETLRQEFQRLEERSSAQQQQLFLLKFNQFQQQTSSSSPIHQQNNLQNPMTSSYSLGLNEADLMIQSNLMNNLFMESELAKEALDEEDLQQNNVTQDVLEQGQNTSNGKCEEIFSTGTDQQIQSSNASNVSTSGFFSKIFRKFTLQTPTANTNTQSSSSSSSTSMPNQVNSGSSNLNNQIGTSTEESATLAQFQQRETLANQLIAQSVASTSTEDNAATVAITAGLDQTGLNGINSLDQFAGHICGQLQYYCRCRHEMIDFYERLTSASNNWNSTVQSNQSNCGQNQLKMTSKEADHLVRTLHEIHDHSDDLFTHPVLNRLKQLFMFELETLLALLKANQFIQHWKYLETLFQLQDAHQKIMKLAYPREFFFGCSSAAPTPISAADPTQLTKNCNVRQSSSISLCGSSALKTGDPHHANIVGAASPNSLVASSNEICSSNAINSSNVIGIKSFENSKTSSSKRLNMSSFDNCSLSFGNLCSLNLMESKSVPSLIQWFNRFKYFLLSKYSFYFHRLLLIHLTGAAQNSVGSGNQSLHVSQSLASIMSLNPQQSSSAQTVALEMFAQTESFMKNLLNSANSPSNISTSCSNGKSSASSSSLLIDFHSKILHFLKKLSHSSFESLKPSSAANLDNGVCMVLVFNCGNCSSSSKSSWSLNGYRSPYLRAQSQEISLSTRQAYQIVYYCGANNKCFVDLNQSILDPNSSLILLIERHHKELNSNEVVVEKPITCGASNGQDSATNSSKTSATKSSESGCDANGANEKPTGGTTYYLVRPDPNFTLVLIYENQQLNQTSSSSTALVANSSSCRSSNASSSSGGFGSFINAANFFRRTNAAKSNRCWSPAGPTSNAVSDDVFIINFMQDLCSLLKDTKIYISLRNGGKC